MTSPPIIGRTWGSASVDPATARGSSEGRERPRWTAVKVSFREQVKSGLKNFNPLTQDKCGAHLTSIKPIRNLSWWCERVSRASEWVVESHMTCVEIADIVSSREYTTSRIFVHSIERSQIDDFHRAWSRVSPWWSTKVDKVFEISQQKGKIVSFSIFWLSRTLEIFFLSSRQEKMSSRKRWTQFDCFVTFFRSFKKTICLDKRECLD